MIFKEVLLRELKRRGIKNIYGVPGRENEHILFNEVEGIEYITTRTEFASGIAAEFSGRMTNKPQVCFSTMGPGATNMTTSVASAMLNKSPLIFFSAQLESDDKFYNITHQCVNQTEIMKPITKWSYEIQHPQELPQVINKAFKIAMTEPVGPVHIAIPTNYFEEDIKINYDIDINLPQQIILPEPYIDRKLLNQVEEALAVSKRTLCLVGQEVIRADAQEEVAELIRKFNIPLLSAANAKGILSEDDKLNYGSASCYMEGILQYNALDDIFCDIDTLLFIGYKYVDDLLPKMWTRGISKRIITLSSDGFFSMYSKFKPDIEIVGNIKEYLKKFIEFKIFPKTDTQILSGLKAQYFKVLNDDKQYPNGMISAAQVINSINKYINDGIFVTDIGYFRHHSIIFSRPRGIQKFFTDTGISSFGVGLPSAIGAKMNNKDKRVILLCGDGGFHASSSDLATLTKYNLPIIIILLNNRCFNLIKLYQSRNTGKKNDNVVELSDVNFVALAKANGCDGIHVNGLKELNDVLEKYNDEKTLLIEVDVLYDDNFVISF